MDPARLPSGYRLRPPAWGESSQVNRLSAICDAALGSAPSLTEGMIRLMWERPRFVLATDAWIVENGPTIVGYGHVWDEAPGRLSGFAFVHPDHVGRGIGTRLAELVEARAAAKAPGGGRLYSAVLAQDEVGAGLLARRGYSWARRFWHMEIELAGYREEPTPPVGVELRPVNGERDLRHVHRLLEEAFEDHWDHAPTSYEEFLDLNVRGEDFDPSLWFMALEDGEPVGAVCGNAHPDRGWVDEVGVRRSHRGRGVGSALLRACFGAFASRGLPRARLNVDSDNPTGAVSLYERVGMHVVSSFDLWERALPAAR
jgi:mycothiol synthase